ncbi:hypothetical protein GCM10023187_18520 [Nibrella viscosa]|uniref:VanZ-like domain-containing protein n=1 Tax=Nibrella viscosa TaxID=1084524 RepID=A0ABP8KB67_9BACT
MKNKSLLWWAALIWTIIIFLGCSVPGPDLPPITEQFNDKWMHTVIFVPYGVLWVLAGYRPKVVLITGILYGIGIELFQGVAPINRTCDWRDALADALGVILGVLVGWAFIRSRRVSSNDS